MHLKYTLKITTIMKYLISGNDTMNILNIHIRISCYAFAFIIAFMYSKHINAQISTGGLPVSFSFPVKDSIYSMVMPAFDVDSLMKEDSISQSQNQEGPFRFGYAIDVNIGLTNSGTWDTLNNGDKIWRLRFISSGAYSINLIYDDFWLPEGAKFYIYNENKDMILGAFTSNNNKPHHKFSTDLVMGDITILEYFEPAYTRGGLINVDKVIHGYKNVFPESGHDQTAQTCHNDINCSVGADWCVENRAASMILLADNTRICSGCLINNVREDLTPYHLTAFHCADSDQNGSLSQSEINNAETWVFRFKYWSPTCNQGDDAMHWVSISGSSVRTGNIASDFLLLELGALPPSGFGVLYAGWDRTTTAPSSSAVIHHPAGSTMKICFDNDPATSSSWTGTPANSHWQVILDNGTTEGGSSGAPLLNQDHRIVGQNHGGFAGCPPVTKWYGKFSVSWNNGLSGYLDPDNTGITSVNATSPTIYLLNRTLTGTHKFAALDEIHIEGNVTTGHPFFGDQHCPPSNVRFTTEPGSNVEIKASRIVVKPGTHFKAGSTVHLTAVNDIDCSDNLVEGNYINVFCNANVSMKTGGGLYNDNVSKPVMEEKGQKVIQVSDYVRIYPNPSSGKFEVELLFENLSSSKIFIYDMVGKLVYRQEDVSQPKNAIDICDYPKGLYTIYIVVSQSTYTKKIIVH